MFYVVVELAPSTSPPPPLQFDIGKASICHTEKKDGERGNKEVIIAVKCSWGGGRGCRVETIERAYSDLVCFIGFHRNLPAPFNFRVSYCSYTFKKRFASFPSPAGMSLRHTWNMEGDLHSLFGLHVTWCAQLYSLAETPQLPPLPPHRDSYTRALLVSKDRRHLFVSPCH
jgi:hypothetical protein